MDGGQPAALLIGNEAGAWIHNTCYRMLTFDFLILLLNGYHKNSSLSRLWFA